VVVVGDGPAILAVLWLAMVGKELGEDGVLIEHFDEADNMSSNVCRLSCVHVAISPGNISTASAKLAAVMAASSGASTSASNGVNLHTSAAQG
jgi:hypothetical protein